MKKLLIMLLVLGLASPAIARRTDMMDSYGSSEKSRKYYTEKKYRDSNYSDSRYRDSRYNDSRYRDSRYRDSKYRKYKYRYYDDDDPYMSRQDRYIGDLYRSKAGRMLYENEHYKNYVDRNRYLRDLRRLELEQRRLELEKRKK